MRVLHSPKLISSYICLIANLVLQGADVTGESSYSGLANRVGGPLAEGALQLGLFGFCFGVMAVYLVVIGDILAGMGKGVGDVRLAPWG